MKKEYSNVMLQIVSINKNDVIATSFGLSTTEYDAEKGSILAPDRYNWDAGY